MRALVTGCAGFIGSHLTEALLARGDEVTGIDCFNDNYGRAQKLANLRHVSAWDGFDFVPVDLARGDLEELTADVDAVLHLAAEPGVRASWGPRYGHFVRNNIVATQHLLDAVKDSHVRFLLASSSSVYGDAVRAPTPESAPTSPLSPYGQTKVAAEQLGSLYARTHGLDVRTMRLFTVFGPRQRPDMAMHRFLSAALDGAEVIVLGDGGQTRDFTYVSDAVGALLSLLDLDHARGTVLNMGGGAPASVVEVLALVEELAGRPLQITRLPAERGEARDTAADMTLARERLTLAGPTGLREGLEAQLEWLTGESLRRTA